MKEYTFAELGYFTDSQINGIKKAMQGKTFMNFDIASANNAGNRTLIVKTDYEADEQEIKNFFLGVALDMLAKAYGD